MLKFQQVEGSPQWWARLAQFPDRTIFQTPEWIRFVAETQHANPIFAELRDGSSSVGFLCALMFSRFGVRILGSPFPGWTTMYMGFTLDPGVPHWLALGALQDFAFRELGCMHFEIADRRFSVTDGERVGLQKRLYNSYETDLTQTEDRIFGAMESACRRCVRKAEKSGVVVEESVGDDSFANDYYDQLRDVFRKQGLVPTYDLNVVRKLIEHVYPTGQLLLLRARDPEGNCIATGIYPGMNKFSQFWGNASYRATQHFRPNEALHWYALRYWRAHGAECFDWGGEGEYKEKYGCRKIVVPRFCKSRIPLLPALRDQAQKIFRHQQRVRGWFAVHYRKSI